MTRERRLWAEDDATCYSADHETLRKAWHRLFGEDFDVVKVRAEKIDHGDADEYRLQDGRVAIATYPGNSEILHRMGLVP